VLDLHDRAATGCDPAEVAALVDALEARRGDWPLWDAGTALFVTDGPAQVAGEFNGWDPAADATTPLCGTALATAALPIASGRWPYKLVVAGAWRLDPGNAAFAFDDYAGNADGENSLLNTHDSGVGHLVHGGELCSTALGNCRAITTYLPRGYHAPDRAQRRYPVIFLHDGQNVFDDHDCCFGHTGWEVNVALDAGVADGSLEEAIVVAADHAGAARNDEYGWSTSVGGAQEAFMAFQVGTIQPAAAARWRLDADRTFVAGSSLGGLISMRLALAYPELYAGAASLSGAFWPGQDTQTALRDVLATTGRVAAGLYVDHGGTAAAGGDGYADNVEVRDLLVGLGWRRADSPACALADDALCYHHEDGGTHDELAWRDRAWRFLRFFVGR
jgi:predicted alpha/beta superfamily hydrolase